MLTVHEKQPRVRRSIVTVDRCEPGIKMTNDDEFVQAYQKYTTHRSPCSIIKIITEPNDIYILHLLLTVLTYISQNVSQTANKHSLTTQFVITHANVHQHVKSETIS